MASTHHEHQQHRILSSTGLSHSEFARRIHVRDHDVLDWLQDPHLVEASLAARIEQGLAELNVHAQYIAAHKRHPYSMHHSHVSQQPEPAIQTQLTLPEKVVVAVGGSTIVKNAFDKVKTSLDIRKLLREEADEIKKKLKE